MRLIALVLITLLSASTLSTVNLAQAEAPKNIQDDLGGIWDMWRDYLWEKSDDFWHKGQYSRCIEMMRLITQVDPHDFDAYESGAWLLQSELRDDEAEAFLLQGLKKNQDTYNLYFSLGYFYYYHERYQEAIRYLQTAVVLGASQQTWHQLAHAYEMGGYPEDAFGIWSMVASAYPDDPVPQLQMDRIMRAEPHHNTPGFISRAREQRMMEKKNEAK